MAFHEKWFSAPKQRRLAEEMDRVDPRLLGSVVEVGSWEGRSTIQIARHFNQVVHAVDHWQGDLTDPRSKVADLAAARDVYADFEENLREAQVWPLVQVHRMDWRDLDWMSLAPIKFLFIDGQHTFDEVYDNLSAAWPLMAAGGVVAGDDYTVQQVGRAVRSFFTDPDVVHRCAGPGAAVWGVVA